jgi:hypothetical protein
MRPPKPHTPAPWKSVGCEVTTVGGEPIGRCLEPPNARRIVAAVNACESIPIRELEGGILADLFFQCGRLKNARIASIMERLQPKRKTATERSKEQSSEREA